MRRAANFDEVVDAEYAGLLERLCDLDARVVHFPVRHHSPTAAALVEDLIRRIGPAEVLIEGPSDYNEQIDEFTLDHDPPIALYSYFRAGGSSRGAYHPFCEYSPEWVAARAGRAVGAAVRFIDLPWPEIARLGATSQRYADAELCRGRYVRRLCERMGAEDFDELWDMVVESRRPLPLEDYLARVHSICFHIRLWEESVSVEDRRREAFMADRVCEAKARTDRPILVVTGGFHSSALAARVEGLSCPGIDDPPEPVPTVEGEVRVDDAGVALTTYSYERLDSLTGYEAGMPSPGFYEHAWRSRRDPGDFTHRPLLAELVRELRARKQTLSTADLIAVETSARALAALRGRSFVWRRDLIDGVTSALIKDELEYGCRSPFIDAIHAVLRGNRRGKLAQGTRVPPLVDDIRARLTESGLEPTPVPKEPEFDLLRPEDTAKSRLLHQLKVLEISGFDRIGGTDFLKRDDLSRLWESWRVRWSPEFDSTCVEAARYGVALADAVAARLTEAAKLVERDAAAAAALLLRAARAGVEAISDPLIDRVSELIREETRFEGATEALGHLLYLYHYDEAFGAVRLPRVGGALSEAYSRSLWLLEGLGRTVADDRAFLHGMKTMLETTRRLSTGRDGKLVDPDEFVAVAARVEGDPGKPPAARGAAAGVLWTLGAADEDRILADLMMFALPEELGDFLSGLFAVGREVAQRNPKLVGTVDRLLVDFGADDFQTSLPSLRLAFTYFTPREKHYMLTTLFESLGLKTAAPLEALAVDEATAAEVLAFEGRLYELAAKYGLEAPRE